MARRTDPSYDSGTGSVAAIAGHPLHPMIVPLPIAAFVATLLADIGFLVTGDAFWAYVARWAIGFGLVTGLLAALLGVIELMSIARARTLGRAWLHGAINVGVLALALVNLLARRYEPTEAILPVGILLSAAVVVMVAVAGWLGGELVYRHGIAVSRKVGPGYDFGDEDHTPRGRSDIGHG